MLIFLGLHASSNTSRLQRQLEKPSFCVENRRLIFAYIFSNDKAMVSFTGRPPLLSRRYCSTPPLLDLSDESMLADEAVLAEHVKALDPKGWNTEGKIYGASYIRARYLMAYAFDEVIEVALGHDAHVTLEYLQ